MESIVDSLLFRLSHPEKSTVDEVVYSLPEDAILNPEVRFLDPAMGGGQFLRGILDRAISLGMSREEILPRLYGIERSIVYVNHAKWKLGLDGANLKVSSCYDPEVFGVEFDYVVGNPPYSDRSGNTSKSKDLDDKFTLISAELGENFSLIIRSKHFTNPRSSFRKKLFSTGGVVSISYLSEDFFPSIQNTETCIVTWSKDHSGPAKVTYKDGNVLEKELAGSTVIKLDNPNFVTEVESNLAHRWFRGKLNRNKFEKGDCPIVEICGTGDSPVINYIREGQEDIGRDSWGVVINVAAE